MQCGHAQNRLWARLRPFRARNFSRWLSVGLSDFSPEISEITAFRWYIHASDFPPKSQT